MTLTFSEWAQLQVSRKIFTVDITLLASTNTTLRVASSSGVWDGSNYYEGAVAGLPSFSRSIKGLAFGSTQASFGTLTLNNGDGWLDSYLEDYNWVGADITIKVGGPALDYSSWPTVISAYIKNIILDDEFVRCQIADKTTKLLRNRIASNTWNGSKVYAIVDDILTECGIGSGDRDSTLWTQFETDANMTAYVETDGTEAASTLLDRILPPLMFWYGFSRTGLFQVALLRTASSGDYTLQKDVDEMTAGKYPYDKHYWKINVSYISTTPDTRTIVSQSDSSIKTNYPLAMESGVKDTVLDNETDANTTLTRWWDMLHVRRWVVKTGLKAQGWGLGIGDAFTLTRSRLGVSGSFRIVSVDEDFDNSVIVLEGLQ